MAYAMAMPTPVPPLSGHRGLPEQMATTVQMATMEQTATMEQMATMEQTATMEPTALTANRVQRGRQDLQALAAD